MTSLGREHASGARHAAEVEASRRQSPKENQRNDLLATQGGVLAERRTSIRAHQRVRDGTRRRIGRAAQARARACPGRKRSTPPRAGLKHAKADRAAAPTKFTRVAQRIRGGLDCVAQIARLDPSHAASQLGTATGPLGSARRSTTTSSTGESEPVVACPATRELTFVRALVEEMGHPPFGPTETHTDGVVALSRGWSHAENSIWLPISGLWLRPFGFICCGHGKALLWPPLVMYLPVQRSPSVCSRALGATARVSLSPFG